MISVGVLMTVYLDTQAVSRGHCTQGTLSGLVHHLQFDDMGVPEQLQILDLALYSAGHVAADQLLAGDDLEGDLLAGAPVDGQLDLAEGALSQGLDDVVLANALVCLDLIGQRPCGRGRHGVCGMVDDDVGGAQGGVVDVDPASSHL